MRVTLVYSPEARRIHEWAVDVPEHATAQQGLALLMTLLQANAPLDVPQQPDSLTLAVWGRKAIASQSLRDGDRLEWLRPLRVDPKRARRERFQQQGARNTGLFARRRAGAKPGY
jgi:putative ubiquitin-RnfH superfamily antitoxin RatB of RatAB toxin-antitoxin module